MTYIVEARRAGDLLERRPARNFDAALGYRAEFVARYGHLRYAEFPVYNSDRCDYCTEDGWDDGLTEDEREMIGGRADGC